MRQNKLNITSIKKVGGLSIIVLTLFSIVSCKKETTQFSSIPVDPGDTAKYVNGWLRKYTTYFFRYGNPNYHALQKGVLGCAFFSRNLVAVNDTGFAPVNVGPILLNDVFFDDPIASNSYTTYWEDEDPLKQINKWAVINNTGKGFFPFTHYSYLELPTFSGHKKLTNYISKNKGLYLKFENFTTTDRIRVYLYDGHSPSAAMPCKTVFVKGDTASVSFAASDLKNLELSQYGEAAIDIYFFNDEILYLHGKNLRFSNVLREYIMKVTIDN